MAQNNIDLPVEIEPIVARNNIDLPIVAQNTIQGVPNPKTIENDL